MISKPVILAPGIMNDHPAGHHKERSRETTIAVRGANA
jgi:hypothetical protein